MADVNYLSPAGLAPKVPEMPGFLGGMQARRQETDYRDLVELQKAMAGMGAMKTHEDLVEGAPVRQATRLADIATAQNKPARLEAELQGLLLGNRKSGVEVRQAEANSDVNIQAARAEALAKIPEANRKRILAEQQSILDSLDGFSEQVTNSLDPAATMTQMLQKAGVDANHPMARALLQAHQQDPQKGLVNRLDGIKKNLVQSIAHLQKMEELQQQGANSERVAEIAGDASVYSADQHLRAAQYRSEREKTVAKLEGSLVKLLPKIATGKATPEERREYDLTFQLMANLKAVGAVTAPEQRGTMLGNTNPPRVPGTPGVTPTPGGILTPEQVQSMGQTPQPGFVYRLNAQGELTRDTK